jgi:integrase
MKDFAAFLADKVDAYIQLRQSLGYLFRKQAATLRAFCRFVTQHAHAGPLTQELALAFVHTRHVVPGNGAVPYGVIRRFAEYLAVFDSRTARLDPRALLRNRAISAPRILDDGELARLLAAARDGSPRHPLRGLTLSTIIGLLASTGLRSGEALRLDRAEVDLERGHLHIRLTKFRKDRLVPVHPSAREALLAYAAMRDRASPRSASPAFFLSLRGQRLSPTCLTTGFRQAATRAGLDGRMPRPPRPHDLRHRFAVTRLVRWHHEGVDVQRRLPLLATYLGHARYSDTAYYVTGTAELLGVAAERAFGRSGDAS